MNNFKFDLDATDEDFFGNLKTKSSKLQQLFGEEVLTEDERQQSLKYKRPKATDLQQTDATKNETLSSKATNASSSQSITLIAKVVTAYREGEQQGKVGLALIKNIDDSFNILMYKSKTNILVTLRLDRNAQILFKQNKYWQFYDDLRHYWSFSFESAKDEDDFRDILTHNGHTFRESEGQQVSREEEERPEEKPSQNVEETQEMDLPQLPPSDVSKDSKNALLKRIAKMGQSLPKLTSNSQQTTTEFSDSSDTEVINMPLPQKPPAIAPRTSKLVAMRSNQQLVTSSVACNPSSIYPANAMESQYMQMVLTEQRTQGSELRMNMNKLENKIEKVLDKLDLIDRSGLGETKEKRHKDDEILELEEKILNLKKENRKLKQLTEQRNEQETYEQKSKEILEEFQDELNDIRKGQVKDLRTLLKQCIETIQDNRESVKELQKKQQEWEREKQKQLEAAEGNNQQLEQQLKDLQQQIQQLKSKLEDKEKLIKDFEQQTNDLKKDLEEKTKEKSLSSPESIVKTIMNNLYADICDKLESSQLDNGDRILAIVAASIKQQTLKSLQQQQSEK